MKLVSSVHQQEDIQLHVTYLIRGYEEVSGGTVLNFSKFLCKLPLSHLCRLCNIVNLTPPNQQKYPLMSGSSSSCFVLWIDDQRTSFM